MSPPRPRQRLYLFTPRVAETGEFAPALDAALAAADIAAVLLRLDEADERTLINRAKTIAALVQRHDVALLLDGHVSLVVRAGADGAHLTGIEAVRGALSALKPERIVGAGGLHSRHDAMLAAESGADYVMFGEPDRRGSRPSFAAIEERLQWWAELFEPPCVGYAADLDEVPTLVRAGADFVALGDWIWTQEGGPAALVTTASGLTERV